jgi:hypothetical protein
MIAEQGSDMRPLAQLICILTLTTAGGEELIFFAEDHYKGIGAPELRASAVNPMMEPGSTSTLRIALANAGIVEELIPTSPGPEALSEAEEELHNADAWDVAAKLSGSGPVKVTSGPFRIKALGSGAVAFMDFEVTAGDGAEGPYDLRLDLEYERQVDVSVSNGTVSPLYQPAHAVQSIRIDVRERDGPFRVEEVRSDLHPGESGTLLAVIQNGAPIPARNCTARLAAAPPIRPPSRPSRLGDLLPGEMAVASFPVWVDGNATAQVYQLGCEIRHDNGTALVAVPVAVGEASRLGLYLAASLFLLLLAAAAAMKNRLHLRRGRRSR